MTSSFALSMLGIASSKGVDDGVVDVERDAEEGLLCDYDAYVDYVRRGAGTTATAGGSDNLFADDVELSGGKGPSAILPLRGRGGDDDGGGDVDVVLLVPRGGCTFQKKALSAQALGASSVVVYNTMASRYGLNETALVVEGEDVGEDRGTTATTNTTDTRREPTFDDILWPRPKKDYDCEMWQAGVPRSLLSFDPLPYDASHNDPLLSRDDDERRSNLCAVGGVRGGGSAAADFEDRCESGRCLLTGFVLDGGDDMMEACCAWDRHIRMATDRSLNFTEAPQGMTIPALFLTMEQGRDLLGIVSAAEGEVGGGGATARMYGRWHPFVNLSSFLLWALATFITWLSAWSGGAGEYRKVKEIAQRAVGGGELTFRTASNERRRRTVADADNADNGESEREALAAGVAGWVESEGRRLADVENPPPPPPAPWEVTSPSSSSDDDDVGNGGDPFRDEKSDAATALGGDALSIAANGDSAAGAYTDAAVATAVDPSMGRGGEGSSARTFPPLPPSARRRERSRRGPRPTPP